MPNLFRHLLRAALCIIAPLCRGFRVGARNDDIKKYKEAITIPANKNISEFIRYIFVGGIAFLADLGTLTLLREYVFNTTVSGLYIATAGGFCCGIIINTVLSVKFVFTDPDVTAKKRGRNIRDLALIFLIGIIGLGLTEIGMYIGTQPLSLDYRLTKIIVSGLVLFWNFLARKLIVFK